MEKGIGKTRKGKGGTTFNFEKLQVYKDAVGFAGKIYSLTRRYPKEELFGLTSQLRRAAVSIALNIAEGSARTKKDFSRFVDMARGSALECVAVIEISLGEKYVETETYDDLRSDLGAISRMLSGLKRSLCEG